MSTVFMCTRLSDGAQKQSHKQCVHTVKWVLVHCLLHFNSLKSREHVNAIETIMKNLYLLTNFYRLIYVTKVTWWWPRLGICALRLTHPKCTHTAVNTHTHTPGAVGSHLCYGARGAVGGSFDYESESLTIRPRLPPPHVSTSISPTPIIYNYLNVFFSLALALAYANYVKWFRFIL